MCKKGVWLYMGKCNQTVIAINEKELSLRPNSLMLNSRDDKIRTCDHTTGLSYIPNCGCKSSALF